MLSKLLIDPYATRVDGAFTHHADLTRRGAETAQLVPKCIVEAQSDLAAVLPPSRPGFIYELPVKAFTMRHPAVPPALRGTVAALAEPCVIEHLVTLGVDTVELMPLMAWIDERHLAQHWAWQCLGLQSRHLHGARSAAGARRPCRGPPGRHGAS